MKKLLVCVLLLAACLCFAGFASAQTYLYHETISEANSGSLNDSIPIGETFFLRVALNVDGLTTSDIGTGYVMFSLMGEIIYNFSPEFYSDQIYLNFGEEYWTDVSLSGDEIILFEVNPLGNLTITINGLLVKNIDFTGENIAWEESMENYESFFDGVTGDIEVWVSLTDPTPTPTPTPTASPTTAPTSWVHNTAVPIGGNIGGLNTIILLLLLAGVGLSMMLLVISKLKSNIIEAIIIMFVMGTAGLVAILWLIGGFA